LNLFVGRKNINNDAKNEFLKKKCLPWSIDIWSLGVNILEAVVGIPIWMSFKCKKMHKGKPIFTTGFFSATGRSYEKIIKNIKLFMENFKKNMKFYLGDHFLQDELIDF